MNSSFSSGFGSLHSRKKSMLAPIMQNSPLVEGRKAVVYHEGHHKTKEAYKEAL